jgi:hypothetical protein
VSKRISTISDYLASKKKRSEAADPNLPLVLPGYTLFEKKTFRLNSLDLPYTNMADHRKRNSAKELKDYGPLMNDLPFAEILNFLSILKSHFLHGQDKVLNKNSLLGNIIGNYTI